MMKQYRKNILFISLISLLTHMCTCSQDSNWVLVWSDEFDGPNIDTSKWIWEIGNNNGWGNRELEYYTNHSKNSFIQNGNLVIQAIKESTNGFAFTSARLKTEGLFSTKYGKLEISAKLPQEEGLWPAFWLLGDNFSQVGWPACGEIDVMELLGKYPKKVFGSVHATGINLNTSYTDSNGFGDSYHTFTVDWQPDYLSYYVNGNLYATYYPSQAEGKPWPFNQNFFIILNLAVGGNWPGSPENSTFPQQFIIDYVRVWQKASF